jgi:ATP-dependent RNA helicase DHX8/PRP22
MADDASGLLPEWVAYGELVENANSSRPFLRNVCVVDPAWVAPLVARITESPNIANLRGGGGGDASEASEASNPNRETGEGAIDAARERRNDKEAVEDARRRYLERKRKAAAAAAKK